MPPRKPKAGGVGGAVGKGVGATLSGSIANQPGRANPDFNVYPVTELLATNNTATVPKSPQPSNIPARPTFIPPSYAQTAAQAKSKQTQPVNLQQRKMSGKQASAGGKAPQKGPTLHGRPALDVPEPAPPRLPPKPKGTGPPPNENWEQDGEMNAHLAEKFRKGTFRNPESGDQGGREPMLPPHPLLAK